MFEFGIVMMNTWFVDSDHSCHNTCNPDLKFLPVLLSQPKTKSHLFSCEQMRKPHGAYTFHFEFLRQYSVHWHFRYVQVARPYSSGQMSIIFSVGNNDVGVDFSHRSSWPTISWCIIKNWLLTISELFMALFNARIIQAFVSKSVL